MRPMSSFGFAPDMFEGLDIDAVEAFADTEYKHGKYKKRDEHRESDTDLDDERHAARAGGSENQAIFQRHEANDLGDRIAPRDHHQHPEENNGERQGQAFTRE